MTSYMSLAMLGQNSGLYVADLDEYLTFDKPTNIRDLYMPGGCLHGTAGSMWPLRNMICDKCPRSPSAQYAREFDAWNLTGSILAPLANYHRFHKTYRKWPKSMHRPEFTEAVYQHWPFTRRVASCENTDHENTNCNHFSTKKFELNDSSCGVIVHLLSVWRIRPKLERSRMNNDDWQEYTSWHWALSKP